MKRIWNKRKEKEIGLEENIRKAPIDWEQKRMKRQQEENERRQIKKENDL